MPDITKRISQLSPEKRDLLLHWLTREEKTEKPQLQPIHPLSRETDTFSLSFAQERLWLLDQLEPGNFVYNIPQGIRLKGNLNIVAFEQSLNEILARHEALRTNFTVVNGEPVQVIAPIRTISLPLIDLSGMLPDEQTVQVEGLTKEEAQRPFNLSEDLLIRVTLLRLDTEEHIFLLVMHHIISDAWSTAIIARELGEFYTAFITGEPSPLPPLPIQYVDFARWQREWLQEEKLNSQLAYWKEQLGGNLPVLELPLDRLRPHVQTFRGERERLRLSTTLSKALNALSYRESVTLFMTLLSAFKLLLYRYTGQTDIIVGSPIAGRNRTEVENLIGFFLNTLVLRTAISGDLSFRELLGRVKKMALEAYARQDVPFEKLLAELQPERDLSRTPLFQVFFNMLNVDNSQIELPELTVEVLPIPEIGSKFDITLYVKENGEAITLTMVYNADLFTRERMREVLAQFNALLAQIIINPDRKIDHFTLITDRARAWLPDPSQGLGSAWQGAIHTAFSRQARRAPENIAVIDGQDTWTYHELDARSNQLANYLCASGIQPQDVVAIYGHRNASLVWAVLGVLKAGAAFLILDPANPPSRLIECLRQAQPRGWLQIEAADKPPLELLRVLDTRSFCCQLLLPGHNVAVRHAFLAAHTTDDPKVTVGPDDLACISFTSGSTGKPKGILGRHGSLTHFMPWQEKMFDLDGSDCFSMLSGLAHDPLQRDMFTAFWVGGKICIPDSGGIGEPGWLARWLKQEKVTITHLTPAMGQLITETVTDTLTMDDTIPSLRYAFFVGDILTRQDVARLRRLGPNLTAVNFYGSTETQRAVGYYVISNLTENASVNKFPLDLKKGQLKEVIPLGRGIQDVQLLILNASQQLAGVGEVGEIYVRSHHLALGYLGDEEQTQVRFIANPFTRIPNDRLYCTGDLGRYLPDGNVEFIGRADTQVKIRGFRVELGEIEAVLGQHPAVRGAIVMVRQSGAVVSPRLVAYVTPVQHQPRPTFSEVRNFLQGKLPHYMVPSAFVFLETLPLTPNGKVDRLVLPMPEQIREAPEETLVAPRDKLELQLTKIWERVLDINPIGVKDNFFDLGGHSLLAVSLFAQIEKILDKRLPLAMLFQAPTIEQLANRLRPERGGPLWSSLVPIQPLGSKPPFFCVPPMGGIVVSFTKLARYLGKDQPFYGLQAYGLEETQIPHTRVEDIAAHYVKEIQTIQPEGPYFLGGRCFGGTIAYEMAQQLQAAGQRVALLAMLDAAAPMVSAPPGKSLSYYSTTLFHHRRPADLRNYLKKMKRDTKNFVRRKVAWEKMPFLFSPQKRRLLSVIKAHEKAKMSYIPQPYSGAIIFFRAADKLNRVLPNYKIKSNWSDLVGKLNTCVIPGSHKIMLQEPYVQTLAKELTTFLDKAWPGD